MLIQTQRPNSASDNHRSLPVPLLARGQEQPSTDLVDPDIPTNFDDLSDDELAELIRSLLAQAAALYQSGSLLEEREQPQRGQGEKAFPFRIYHVRHMPNMYGGMFITPVAQRASLFSTSQQGGAK